MNHFNVISNDDDFRQDPPARFLPLGHHLVNSGKITETQLVKALELQSNSDALLGEVLVSQQATDLQSVTQALSDQIGLRSIDLAHMPPDPDLFDQTSINFWLQNRVVPWKQMGTILMVATSRPDMWSQVYAQWDCPKISIFPVLAQDRDIQNTLAQRYDRLLAAKAATRVPSQFSCRLWENRGPKQVFNLSALTLGLTATSVLLFPQVLMAVASFIAIVTLGIMTALKLTGLIAGLKHTAEKDFYRHGPVGELPLPGKMPKVSILIPLFREKEIANTLVSRLSKLTYPKVLLDVKLVLEQGDTQTLDVLERTKLPHWMQVVKVPSHGALTTKPRAMNYALDFCDGKIIGVWDAEDAPQPDQIECAVAQFHHADDDVVCLQDVLDFYNPHSNWIARCFTIEYASWWRVILPGLACMGHLIPLGGTTLFFRRDKLEELGAWDAHNVTEDAELGVRLARFGYRTKLIPTVTYEEAIHRAWPWIKQRSRWLKGFMVTYLVHMRDPAKLWRDLGSKKFWGFQAFFVSSLSQFLFAPVLWAYWAMTFCGSDAFGHLTSNEVWTLLFCFFLFSSLLNAVIGLLAIKKSQHHGLAWWVPMLIVYFAMGTVAAYKALYELLVQPFYWDKTQHGVAHEDPEGV